MVQKSPTVTLVSMVETQAVTDILKVDALSPNQTLVMASIREILAAGSMEDMMEEMGPADVQMVTGSILRVVGRRVMINLAVDFTAVRAREVVVTGKMC